MSDSSDEDVSTPVELPDTAQAAQLSLLPEKSRLKYMKAFDLFNTWRHKKGAKTFSETVVLSYFVDLAKTVKPSTLWSVFSMLKATLKLKKDVHIEKYPKLLAFIRRTSSGHIPKKSKIFTAEDITKFLTEAPDSEHLATKVVLIIGISGACRTQELTYLTTNHFEKHSEKLLLFKLPDTKSNIERNFVVRDEFVEVVKKYLNLRPQKTLTDRFFLGYRKGKCINQPMGSNKIGSLPREIATFLGLASPEQYTGHCFRRTSATLLADSGADLSTLRRHIGRKSSTVAEVYLEDSNKLKICKDSEPNTRTRDPLESPPLDRDKGKQCRFCGEFSNDCVAVSAHMPYLAGHKTALALNHIRLELDFSNDSLPKTVCRNCDAKLHDICDFVKQVNIAQFSLVTVCEKVNTTVNSKAEFGNKERVDALTITEAEYEKKTPNKRKIDDKGEKTSKRKTISKDEHGTEFITDIKVELIETDVNVDFNDTGTDVKPTKLELDNSATVYQMSDTSQTSGDDWCISNKNNSENSDIEISVTDGRNLNCPKTEPLAEDASYQEDHVLYNMPPFD